jgi:diacylglycerol kinase (ATP)
LEPDRFLNPERLGFMKIALLHNTGSGRRVSSESLHKVLADEGHELVRVVERADDASALADPPAELAVAAGGDGTVADALRGLAGRGVPLAVLPLGTANNIAFTLGVDGPIEQLARSWPRARAVPFDLGVLHGSGGPQRFVESVGGGLIEECLTSFRRRPLRGDEPPPWELVRALRRYKQVLTRLRPQRWSMRLDGRPFAGEFLLVEILNTRAVGPNLELAPATSPSDGVLTVVTAREADRRALASYIEDRLAGRPSALSLAAEPARCVDIDEAGPLHVDDTLARLSTPTALSIRVQAAAVNVLLPPNP